MTLSAGTKLGPYEILAPIGAGGMGEVYKARDTRLERTVAVKVLPQHLSSSPEVRQRFEREAKTVSQLSHPHICALYDVGREGETEYLVMEYLEGETLSARLANGSLPLSQTLKFGVEIADALDKAHRQGIVHRDLKPGNVMLTKTGVKLLDFGLAKAMAPAAPSSGATSLPTVMGAADGREPDAGGDDPRDVPVHGAGAAGGEGSGRADGHLRVRVRAVRDGDGAEGVRGLVAGVVDLVDHEGGAGAGVGGDADVAAGAGPGDPEGAVEGPGGPVAERGGSGQRAEVDRGGRLGERDRGAGAAGAAQALRLAAVGGRAPVRGGRVRRGPADSPRPRGLPFPLFDRASARDGSGSLDFASDLTRRLDARLLRDRIRPEAPALDSPDGRLRRAADRRDGRRHGPVLVSRQPLDRVLRGSQAQARARLRAAPSRRSATRRTGAGRAGASTTSSCLRRLPSRAFTVCPPRAARRWP